MSSYRPRAEITSAFKDFLVELRGIELTTSQAHFQNESLTNPTTGTNWLASLAVSSCGLDEADRPTTWPRRRSCSPKVDFPQSPAQAVSRRNTEPHRQVRRCDL